MMTRIVRDRAALVLTAAPVILGAGGPFVAVDSPAGQGNTVGDRNGKVMSEARIYDQGGNV